MEINIPELQDKLYKKLVPSGWAGALKGFLVSEDFTKILEKLVEESAEGKKFTPRLSQLLRAFEECPYDKLSTVIVGQDPYPYIMGNINMADGIAFSLSNTVKVQPSLEYIHKAIKKTVYQGEDYQGPMDLKIWANQGVLLLNIALTTTVGKSGTHYQIWRPFIVYLLDMLSWNRGGLVWVFMGKKAQEYMKCINDNCYKLTTSHPAAASYGNQEEWNSEGVFPRINELLAKNNKEIIKW